MWPGRARPRKTKNPRIVYEPWVFVEISFRSASTSANGVVTYDDDQQQHLLGNL